MDGRKKKFCILQSLHQPNVSTLSADDTTTKVDSRVFKKTKKEKQLQTKLLVYNMQAFKVYLNFFPS